MRLLPDIGELMMDAIRDSQAPSRWTYRIVREKIVPLPGTAGLINPEDPPTVGSWMVIHYDPPKVTWI